MTESPIVHMVEANHPAVGVDKVVIQAVDLVISDDRTTSARCKCAAA